MLKPTLISFFSYFGTFLSSFCKYFLSTHISKIKTCVKNRTCIFDIQKPVDMAGAGLQGHLKEMNITGDNASAVTEGRGGKGDLHSLRVSPKGWVSGTQHIT